ncbi:uncharacterized protein LOC128995467 [Macrosteles quadrilineatus]|uniref:uncharacterized protein LOC128995467 n=1 Tax=Macrosteles quadrilineatus TaxID=74068 RepID=UPI0023E21167|nr:uncharacterized protein LOC128995467 [Macrosteles quadrilineatus]
MTAWTRTSYILLLVAVVVVDGTGVFPAWQQYFPPRKWAFYDEQVHGRPGRVRVGRGHYRLGPAGAELICNFPPHLKLVSNVVWERADLGDRNSLNQIYRRFGISHEFTVQYNPTGSALRILNPGPLDKGLYRCLASAVDLSSPARHSMSIFQDIEFFPKF